MCLAVAGAAAGAGEQFFGLAGDLVRSGCTLIGARSIARPIARESSASPTANAILVYDLVTSLVSRSSGR